MSIRYRLSLLPAIVLALLLSGPATAQEREVSGTSPAIVEVVPDRGGDELPLRYFEPDGDATIFTSEGGYVFGTNEFGDLGKSVAFELPAGTESVEILRINAYMFTSGSAVLSEYDAVVWSGTAETGPEDEIARLTFDVDDIVAQGGPDPAIDPTVHAFDDPVSVDGPFHVGFQWDANHGGQDIGMVSTPQLAEPSPYEWEQWDDLGWRNLAAAWGFNGANVFIEVVVRDAAVSSEDGAQAEEIVLSSVFPNPVSSVSHIELDAGTAQHISADVFNVLGQRVATVFEGTAPAGRSVLPVNGSNLVPGMYMVRVVGEDFSMTRRFIVAN